MKKKPELLCPDLKNKTKKITSIMRICIVILMVWSIKVSTNLYGQQNQIVTGTIKEASTGETLAGVTVQVKGTMTGTLSQPDGTYRVNLPANATTLIFSFIGYETMEIEIAGRAVIDVTLTEKATALEEVVVIGYGTMRKSDVTGSISSVSAKELERANPINVQQAIQGRATGVMVSSNSGAPGTEATVRIRGIGTVNTNDPVYVVDGVMVSSMNYLNPSDVSSIEVLKDASATAIYGSRGANGVILITTKKGTSGSTLIDFDAKIGFVNPTKYIKMLNADQYYDMLKTAVYNGYMRSTVNPNPNWDPELNSTFIQAAKAELAKGYNTDWIKEVINENSLQQNYALSLTGGSDKIKYAFSGSYLDQAGLMMNTSYNRLTFRLNTEYQVNKFLKVGENFGMSTSRQDRVSEGSTGSYGEALWCDPLTPVLKPLDEVDINDPNYEYIKYAGSKITTGQNAVSKLAFSDDYNKNLNLVGNVFAELTILKDLKFRSSFGINNTNSDTHTFLPVFFVKADERRDIAQLTRSFTKNESWLVENLLTYDKTFAQNRLSVLLGYTSEYTSRDNITASKQTFASNDKYQRVLSAGSTQDAVSGTKGFTTMESLLFRVNYSYSDKYLLTGTVRRDGSSKFGPGNKWGTFPSFSFGWRLSQEDFFSGLNLNAISNIKLRAGWGIIGNQSLTNNSAYLSTLSSGNHYVFSDAVNNGYYINSLGTPDIKWESTTQSNFGVDFGFLEGSLTAAFDYFIKDTKDMLIQVPVPSYAGYGSAIPWKNAGELENRGWETELSYQGKTGDFNYNISVNASRFTNEVTSLGGSGPIVSGPNRTAVGSSVGRLYGWVTDGIFQTEAEVQAFSTGGVLAQPNAHAGDFRYKDLNNDGKVNDLDRDWIGNPLPDLVYGANLSLSYKSFDFSAFFQGSYGNDIYNAVKGRVSQLAGYFNGFEYVYNQAWRGEGTSNTVPIMTTVNANDNFRISDYYIEDGSYVRLKNIQLGYTLPTSLSSKINVKYVRIWLGGTNLLTFTKYTGFDPEIGLTASPLSAGNDSFAYPQTKEFTIGIKVTM